MKAKAALALIAWSAGLPHALACPQAEDPERLAAQVVVSDTSISFTQQKDRDLVTLMGTLKNSSGARAGEIVVSVDYFDAQGQLVDTVTQPLYGMVLPANQAVSFRVRDEADKPKAAYARGTARVVSAQALCAPPKKAKPSPVSDLLYSWGPMLLLIGVWILVIRKYNGRKSPQQRMVVLMEQQTLSLDRKIAVLEKLVQAVEKQAPRPGAAPSDAGPA